MAATATTFVRARVAVDIKQRAGAALDAMGLSISDAVRLLLVRVANEGRMPFDLAAPWAQRAELKDDNWHEEVLSIGRRNGVTKEDHEALMQALSEVDKPIEDPMVFEE